MPNSSNSTDFASLAQSKPRRWVFWLGLAITVAYLTFILLYALSNSGAFRGLTANELGDFLAGAFAPLAFLWLVLGFLQQGEELRNSANALWLQSQELQNSVEQQRELVQVTREQLQHERARAVAAEEEASRRSQPKLLLVGTGSVGDGSERRRYSFNLTNAGAPCTDLRIEYQMERRPDRLPRLETGEQFDFDILYKESDFDELPVNITYIDARGAEQERVLKLKGIGSDVQVLLGEAVDALPRPESEEASA